jgi:hypothetical protein
MFVVWLLSILFYWVKLPYIGLLLLSCAASYAFIRQENVTYTNIITLVVSLFFFGLSWSLSELKDDTGGSAALGTFLHLALLLGVTCLISPKFSKKQFVYFSYLFSFFSFIFMLFGRFFYEEKFYFITSEGARRYEFVFSEPSFLAIYSCLILYFLLDNIKVLNTKLYLVILVLILNTLLSGSGSGFILLLIIVFLFARLKLGELFRLSAVFSGLIFIIITFTQVPIIVEGRIDKIISGNVDASTRIRFIAPVVTSLYIAKNKPLLGVGLGFANDYIYQNYGDFYVLIKKTPNGSLIYNTNIDNAWAALYFSTGVLGFCIVLLVLLFKIYYKKISFKTLFFLGSTLFFCGAFIHPLFIGLLFFRQNRTYL